MFPQRDPFGEEKIIGCAFSVSNALGAGFLEKVYQNALLIELANVGLQAEKEKQIQVLYKNQVVGDYFADILVNQQVIVETKAVQSLNEIHQAQLLIPVPQASLWGKQQTSLWDCSLILVPLKYKSKELSMINKICVYPCLSVVKIMKPQMNADKHRLNHVCAGFLEKVYQKDK